MLGCEGANPSTAGCVRIRLGRVATHLAASSINLQPPNAPGIESWFRDPIHRSDGLFGTIADGCSDPVDQQQSV